MKRKFFTKLASLNLAIVLLFCSFPTHLFAEASYEKPISEMDDVSPFALPSVTITYMLGEKAENKEYTLISQTKEPVSVEWPDSFSEWYNEEKSKHYGFAGWCTTTDGTGEWYIPSASECEDGTILYPQWIDIPESGYYYIIDPCYGDGLNVSSHVCLLELIPMTSPSQNLTLPSLSSSSPERDVWVINLNSNSEDYFGSTGFFEDETPLYKPGDTVEIHSGDVIKEIDIHGTAYFNKNYAGDNTERVYKIYREIIMSSVDLQMPELERVFPKPEGATFYGWKDGNNSAYYPGDIYHYGDENSTEGTGKFYAQWDPIVLSNVITSLYPENGKVLDKDNPENGTSSTNYADGKLRIFFDKALKNAGGNRPELDTSVGTLEIHRASDDKVVYQVKSNTEIPFWGASSPYDKAVRLDNATTALDYDTEYYVTMPAGFIKFADGSGSPAIAKGQWGFRTAEKKLLIQTVLPTEVRGQKFIHASNLKKDGQEITTEYPFYYNDSWFMKSSYGDDNYQHDLVKMSLCVAMAAYDSRNKADRSSNIQDLMRKIGFDHTPYGPIVPSDETKALNDTVEYHYPESDTNSIGYAIGMKNLKNDSGEDITVILVAVRGGNYDLEWGGNFNVGAALGKTHAGFSVAAGKVMDGLKKYITKNKKHMLSKVKVWVTGYSRGAATANLVAKRLDDGEITEVSILPEDVYGFCFECPRNTKEKDVKNSLYQNIYVIANPIDFVTKLVMQRPSLTWGYDRYGKTLYLPYDLGGRNYPYLYNRMAGHYHYLTNEDPLVEWLGQSLILDDFMFDLACAAISPEVYSLDQTAFIKGAQQLLAKRDFTWEEVLALPVVGVLIGSHIVSSSEVAALFGTGCFKEAHFAELCLAWLNSLEGGYEDFSDPTYRKVFVNCPVDVVVQDEAGNVVGKIKNTNVETIKKGIYLHIDSNGQKVLAFPNDEEFTIQLEATAPGTVTYTATEYNMDSGKTEKVISYYEVDVKQGDTLTGIAENLDNGTAAYPLTLNDGTALTPTINQSGSAVQEFTVNANATGNGTVTGGGYFVCGEFSKVTATANSGEEFLGWYVGGQLVSSDAEYRFLVNKQIDIVGRFTQNVNPSTPGSSGGSSYPSSINYSITTPTTENGTISVNPKSAYKGNTVTITATPDAGYQLDSLTVKDSSGKALELTDTGNGKYTFTMPGSKVSIDATFKPIPAQHKIQIAEVKNGSVVVEPKSATAGTEVSVTVQPNPDYQLAKLAILDENGHEIAVTDKPDGKFVFTMPDGEVSIRVEFQKAEQWKNPYSDVAEGTWYYENVKYVTENNLMSGYGNGKFGPDDNLSRAQITQLLYNKEGKPAAVANEKYTDVKSGAWYAVPVAWADGKGLVNGYGAGKFGPNDPITREQLATILYRYAGSPKTNGNLNRFSDAGKVSTYAVDALHWAVENGIVRGKGATLDPLGRATRKEVAAMIQRYILEE